MKKPKQEEWSKTITTRRLNWIGHFLRLSENTPARRAFYEALQPEKRKRGKPKTTWLKTIEKDLRPIIDLKINDNNPENTLAVLIALTKAQGGHSIFIL